jgi:hypothetical protein
LNKAPWGGLYTPAAGRVRQADCHHLYNYETNLKAFVSRDTLQPEQLTIDAETIETQLPSAQLLQILL